MKQHKNKKSLSLQTETLRALQEEKLADAGGGWVKSWDLPCLNTNLVSLCRICLE